MPAAKVKKKGEKMQKPSDPKGVTLFEMILVIVLITIGAALAVPNFQSSLSQRKADGAIATLKSISNCIRQYKIEHSETAPPNLQTLVDNGCLDPNQYEPGFNYSYTQSPTAVTAVTNEGNKYGDRTITLSGAGSLDQSTRGIIYDCRVFAESCEGSNTKLFRQMYEMPKYDGEQVS